jgi:uncharacterized protein with HEPN domain
MSQRETVTRLRHMLDHAREAVAMTKGRTRADVVADRQLSLALVRLLEIIGEAAARIPQQDRALYPNIPWPQIVSLRNRLIHGYDSVDLDILWQILVKDLPPLIETLQAVVRTEDPG